MHRCRQAGQPPEARELRKALQRLPPQGDPHDPHYRRLRYARYADDILLGFAGPKTEAEAIKGSTRRVSAQRSQAGTLQPKAAGTRQYRKGTLPLGYDIVMQQGKISMTGRASDVLTAALDSASQRRSLMPIARSICSTVNPPIDRRNSSSTTIPSSNDTRRSIGAWCNTTCWPPTSRTSADYTGSCNSRSSAPWRISIKQAGAPCRHLPLHGAYPTEP